MTARLSLAGSVLALALLTLAGPAGAAIVFVNDSGPPGGDGTSWATAYNDLRTALTAPTTMAGDEIWVAAGIYTPGATPSLSFPLKDGVALYGGFTGTETARGQRDPTTNVTMLSGEIGDADTSADNSEHVVTANGSVLSAVVDGFMIAMGYASLTAPFQGGGLLNTGGSLTLANCTFASNQAAGAAGAPGAFGGPGGDASGGAIHSTGGTLTITSCRFVGNSATGGAGGDNDGNPGAGGAGGAATGGAIHVAGGTVAVTTSTFSANQATGGRGGFATTSGGAGGAGKGGGIGQTSGTLTVSATRFLGNSAAGGTSGDISIGPPGSGEGGGLQTTGLTTVVTNAVFSGNTALGDSARRFPATRWAAASRPARRP